MKSIAFFLGGLALSFNVSAQVFQNSAITNGTLVASAFINDNEGWLADDNGKLWHTTNGGQTWDSTSIEKKFLKLDFTDTQNGYALSVNAAFKTNDGGHTWSQLILPGYIGNAIWFEDSEIGFISGYEMIFKTTDGGQTWTTINTEDVSFLDFYFTNSTTVIAVANDGGYRCIWRTIDGGSSWSNVFDSINYYMSTVWFSNENNGWAAGYFDQIGMGKEPVILKTSDGGTTWEEKYRYKDILGEGESLSDIRFRNATEGYAISRHNYDVYTNDGGETWTLMSDSENISATPVFGLYKSLDGFNDMYLVGKSGTVTIWK